MIRTFRTVVGRGGEGGEVVDREPRLGRRVGERRVLELIFIVQYYCTIIRTFGILRSY